jgi:hypothetical protein
LVELVGAHLLGARVLGTALQPAQLHCNLLCCVATCRTALQHVLLRCNMPHCVATGSGWRMCRSAITATHGAGGSFAVIVLSPKRACARSISSMR